MANRQDFYLIISNRLAFYEVGGCFIAELNLLTQNSKTFIYQYESIQVFI